MLLLPAEALPEGAQWIYELKLDGYRCHRHEDRRRGPTPIPERQGFQPEVSGDRAALDALPDETVVDGEVVALDGDGRPSFNALQNGLAGTVIVYYVFDVLVLAGRNVMGETLGTRRDLLTREVLPHLAEPVREAPRFDASLADLITAVQAQGLEGLVAKRLDATL
jgi:ATP-dependent DNA ligase